MNKLVDQSNDSYPTRQYSESQNTAEIRNYMADEDEEEEASIRNNYLQKTRNVQNKFESLVDQMGNRRVNGRERATDFVSTLPPSWGDDYYY
jgi:hypothetical protein